MRLLLLLIGFAAALPAPTLKKGSPLDNLPSHLEQLTWFGERADFSPDNKRVAFMAKSFGDAFEIDLATRHIRCLTCSIPGAAFLRVQYLVNGDYLINGPERFKDLRTSRRSESELWILRQDGKLRLIPLNQRLSEGAAVSKKALRIAWSNSEGQYPDEVPKGHTKLYVADIDYSGGSPHLANKKMVLESSDPSCRIEAQDFYDNDTKLTYTCYRPGDKGEVMGIDLKTGKTTTSPNRPTPTTRLKASSPTASTLASKLTVRATAPDRITWTSGSSSSTARARTSSA